MYLLMHDHLQGLLFFCIMMCLPKMYVLKLSEAKTYLCPFSFYASIGGLDLSLGFAGESNWASILNEDCT